MRKPSFGKGELEPEVVMVFESDNQFTRDINKLIELRNSIKNTLKVEKLYHTYLVRCQPKCCTIRSSLNCYIDKKLLDKDNHCLLTGKPCEGVLVRPGYDEIMACLPFLVEELEILNPSCIVMFGERVAQFILKSYGYLDAFALNKPITHMGIVFVPICEESNVTSEQLMQLKQAVKNSASIAN